MRGRGLLLASAAVAGLAPCWANPPAPIAPPFPGWPAAYEGRPLVEVPMSARERRFADDFPGRVQTFSDGTRTLILRFVAEPTRRLHPAAQCFEGAGYEVRRVAAGGDVAWARFLARRGEQVKHVRERIEEADGRESWSDVSAWYWSARLGRTRGPWWSVTVVEGL